MTCGSVWNWGASKNCNFQCEDNDKPIQLRVLRRGALSMFWLETQTIDSTIDKPTPQTTKKIQQIAWKSRPSWSKKTSLSHHMLSCLIHLLPCRQFETAINLTSIPVPALNLDVKCRDHCSQQVARPCTTTAIKSIHPDTLQVDKRQSSTHWKHPRKMRLYSASSSSPAFFIRGHHSIMQLRFTTHRHCIVRFRGWYLSCGSLGFILDWHLSSSALGKRACSLDKNQVAFFCHNSLDWFKGKYTGKPYIWWKKHILYLKKHSFL